MDIQIEPVALSGEIQAIPSKSAAHRILIASALADKPTRIKMDFISKDIASTIRALRALCSEISIEDGVVTVNPTTPLSNPNIHCGESGTTARLLLPVMSALCGSGTLNAEGSLLSRPFGTLCDLMESNGCRFDQKKLPISLDGKLKSGHYFVPGNESSQYISGLLFALPLCDGDSRIELTSALQSSGYVDMTINTLKMYGVHVQKESFGYTVLGNQQYISPDWIEVEGDWSNAAFWLAAGVTVNGLDCDSLQKDRLFADVKDKSEIDAAEIPDLVPILSVYAAVHRDKTRIYNIKRLRIKESDRVQTVADMLGALGARVETTENEMIIHGAMFLTGGTVDGANDHRIVMSAAIAACFCREPVLIKGAEAVCKSYPEFFQDFHALGGQTSFQTYEEM